MSQLSEVDLFSNLLTVILSQSGAPIRALSGELKRKRFDRVRQALLSRNLLVPVQVFPTVADRKDVTTAYAPALDSDVILIGYTWSSGSNIQPAFTSRQLRLSVGGREIISNVAIRRPSQGNRVANTSGGTASGFGSATLMCPVIIPAGVQTVLQFTNSPATEFTVPAVTIFDSVLLFCIAVKTCLSDEDREILDRCRQWIDTHEFQEPIILNSSTPGSTNIAWSSAAVNIPGASETRPVSAPLLVRSIASNLNNSRFVTRDTRGHEFSPAGMWQARNLTSNGQALPQLCAHFRLAMPHVLAPGALLQTDHLNGIGVGVTFDGGLLEQDWLAFGCITP